MRILHTIFILLVTLFWTISCTGVRTAQAILDDVETFASDAPDSVLTVLQSIPRRDLRHPGIKARYGLLYTQAQDRCRIAVDNDSLILPSVRYYSLFGSALHRFLGYYYLGQVRQNAWDLEAAMEAFVKAERIRSPKVPAVFRYALHVNKSTIYADILEEQRALDESLKADRYAFLSGLDDFIFNSLLSTALSYYNMGDFQKVRAYADTLSLFEPQASWRDRANFSSLNALLLLKENADRRGVAAYIDSVRSSHPDTSPNLPWARWARAYVRSGSFDKAMDALNHIPEKGRTAYYYSILSESLDSLHRPKESLEAYRGYVQLSDSLDLVYFRRDTRFIEERYGNRERRIRMSLLISGLFLLLASLSAVFIVRSHRHRKAHTRIVDLYHTLKEEYADLQQVMQTQNETNSAARALLGERMRSLGAFLAEEQTSSLDRVSSRLETLTENRKELVDTIGLLFGVYHPSFVSMLLSYGLSVSEVGFCCLHVLGFRTSEIGDVINRSGYYNISSDIRKKLPIGPQKLSSWLKEQFAKTT